MAALRAVAAALLLALPACDPSVVDAVREPVETPTDEPVDEPMEKPIDMPPIDEPPSPLRPAPIHRYSFDGTGTLVFDSKGAKHGEVVGAELPGSGALLLAGGKDGGYVNLPNRLISGLTDATFEVWVTWTGSFPWERIFDFGTNKGGEEPELNNVTSYSGTSYLFLTASSGVDVERNLVTSGLRAAYAQKSIEDETPCHGPADLPLAKPTHVALVIDHTNQSMRLYQNGAWLDTVDLTRPLSAIDDVNNWLGRSNYSSDRRFAGIFDEFRIYNVALTDQEVADSAKAGPDADR